MKLARLNFCWCVLTWLQLLLVSQVNAMKDISITTHMLFDKYDKSLRPSGDGPTVVDVDLYIQSLGEISEKTMDFVVNMHIKQQWVDSRLIHPNITYGKHGLSIITELDRMWLPDLFIKNDKTSSKSDVTTLNAFLRVDENGTVTFSQRVTSTISCPMQLKHYPLDVQTCSMYFESYGYHDSEVILKWKEGEKAVAINEDIELPTHHIQETRQIDCSTTYSEAGSFSCIGAVFVFGRDLNYYIMGVFVPSVLIVILSWLSFWIDKDSTPGRVALSLLTILTMQGQINTSMSQLPKVSYVKMVDVWLTGCLGFVFAGFLEYTVVNALTVKERKASQKGIKLNNEVKSDNTEYESNNNGVQNETNILMVSLMPSSDNVPRSPQQAVTMPTSEKVDFCSRFIFPLLFLLFNLGVWLGYKRS